MDNVKIINGISEAIGGDTLGIPVATSTNLSDIGRVITSDVKTANKFLNALVNKIAMQVVETKMYSNHLAQLKTGKMPLGDTVESLYVNPSLGEEFDPNSTTKSLFTRKKPDVKAIYHTINRQKQFTVTVNHLELKDAFSSDNAFSSLVNSIISSLYSGNAIDEFVAYKELMGQAMEKNYCKKLTIVKPNGDVTNSKKLIKQIANLSDIMVFPSTENNAFSTLEEGKFATTWTDKADQLLILDVETKNDIDMDVLANAFNMDKATIQANTIYVDNFGIDVATKTKRKMSGLIADKGYFRILESFNITTEFFNSQTLDYNYYLTVQEVLGVCPFANATALVYA